MDNQKSETGERIPARDRLYFDCRKHAVAWAADFKELHGKIHNVGHDSRGWFVTWQITIDNLIRAGNLINALKPRSAFPSILQSAEDARRTEAK